MRGVPAWAPWAAGALAVGYYLWQRSVTKGQENPYGGGGLAPKGFVPSGCGGRPGGCPGEAPPPGYTRTSVVPVDVAAYARSLLGQPLGSSHFYQDESGRAWSIHLECHYHPCGGDVKPWGWHKGATAYPEAAV